MIKHIAWAVESLSLLPLVSRDLICYSVSCALQSVKTRFYSASRSLIWVMGNELYYIWSHFELKIDIKVRVCALRPLKLNSYLCSTRLTKYSKSVNYLIHLVSAWACIFQSNSLLVIFRWRENEEVGQPNCRRPHAMSLIQSRSRHQLANLRRHPPYQTL